MKEYERNPKYYKHGEVEPIELIRAQGMSFMEGNVIKYITRYKYAGNPINDLLKAITYIECLIQDVEDGTILCRGKSGGQRSTGGKRSKESA